MSRLCGERGWLDWGFGVKRGGFFIFIFTLIWSFCLSVLVNGSHVICRVKYGVGGGIISGEGLQALGFHVIMCAGVIIISRAAPDLSDSCRDAIALRCIYKSEANHRRRL